MEACIAASGVPAPAAPDAGGREIPEARQRQAWYTHFSRVFLIQQKKGEMMQSVPMVFLRILAFLLLACLCGCSATTSQNGASPAASAKEVHGGFLSRYDLLQPVAGGDGARSWREEGVDWQQYDKVLIERIRVFLKDDSAQKGIDPTDLKMLTDYFYEALKKEIGPTARIVDQPGPGVLGLRIAITDLMPTNTNLSLAGTLTPYAFVAEASSGPASGRPAGSTPYLGECGIEVQFLDGQTGRVVAEFTDTRIGKKYDLDTSSGGVEAAKKWVDGYLDSFTTWNYAKEAFDLWASLFRKRFEELRGIREAKEQ
jgi:hypothetical protein